MLYYLGQRHSCELFVLALFIALPLFAQTDKLHQAVLDAANGFTLMSVAAHPDDEDIEAVTYYRKKFGTRAVIVVASRGEGGQNEIGPELYADLGVVRSEEMRRAEAISGGEYFNLNFVDFGFSKDVRETYQKWGGEEIRRRLVRMIRLLKPQVIITNHDTTSGHGNHQAVGRELLAAFRVAADPRAFPEHIAEGLPVWQPSRLFWTMSDSIRFDLPEQSLQGQLLRPSSRTAARQDTLRAHVRLPVGEYSPWLGKPFARHAAEALSQHRSQGMDLFAKLIPDGPRWRYYRWIMAAPGAAPLPKAVSTRGHYSDDLFSGVSSAWDTGPGLSKKAVQALAGLKQQAGVASPDRHETLEAALVLVDELNKTTQPIAEHLSIRAQELLAVALGVEFGVNASKKVLVTGQKSHLSWQWRWEGFGGTGAAAEALVYALGYRIRLSDAVVTASNEKVALPAGTTISFSSEPLVPCSLTPTRPLAKVIYSTARLPEPLRGESFFTYRGVKFALQRSGLSSAGVPEIAAPIEVAEPQLPVIVIAADAIGRVRLPVQITNNLKSQQIVDLTARQGEQIIGQQQVAVRGDTLISFALPSSPKLPAAPWDVIVEVRSAFVPSPIAVSYNLVPVRLATPAIRVGLVKSYDTTMVWALRAVGIPFMELSDADFEAGDFHQVQTVVVDMRAYMARPMLRANNARFLEWVKTGGYALVMYHKTFEWNPAAMPEVSANRPSGNAAGDAKYFSPYPLHLGRERVTDETAPVAMLDPLARIWHFPNQIVPEDWQGWVQERGLYFPQRWDERFQRMMRVADYGEPTQEGGMLLAQYGKGTYLYTSLVWYRQFRAGVAGAFRLFMNMLAVPQASQR